MKIIATPKTMNANKRNAVKVETFLTVLTTKMNPQSAKLLLSVDETVAIIRKSLFETNSFPFELTTPGIRAACNELNIRCTRAEINQFLNH